MNVTKCVMVKGPELQCKRVCVCVSEGRFTFLLHVAAAHHQWSERQHSGIFYTPIHRRINSLIRPPFPPHIHTHTAASFKKKKKGINIRHEEVAEKWKSRLSCWSCLLLWNFPGNLLFQSFSQRDERVVKEAGGDGVLSIAGQTSTLWSSAHSGASSHVSSASKPKPSWNSGAAGTWNRMRKWRLVSQCL